MNKKYVDEVLRALQPSDQWTTGRELRACLNEGKWWWQKWGGAGFYMLMHELEGQGLVESQWLRQEAGGQMVSVKAYRRPIIDAGGMWGKHL